jgi:hypothetical protein
MQSNPLIADVSSHFLAESSISPMVTQSFVCRHPFTSVASVGTTAVPARNDLSLWGEEGKLSNHLMGLY